VAYLAVPQQTANWLHTKGGLVQVLVTVLLRPDECIARLNGAEFVEGPWRMVATPDTNLLAVWHSDYLSGTGEESWGFLKISGAESLSSVPSIAYETVERELYVINQRLRGLTIDGAYYHRSYANDAHTLVAGRGSTARQFSIGYFERPITGGTSAAHPAIVCIGPGRDFARLSAAAEAAGTELEGLVKSANSLISPSRNRPVYEGDTLSDLRQQVRAYTGRETVSDEYGEVQISTDATAIERTKAHGLTYVDWVRPGSPLTDVQRRILSSDAIDRHPLRIVGPGGSGKTLLMQLLALRRLQVAAEADSAVRVLYVVHNRAMAETVRTRLDVLEAGMGLSGANRTIDVSTLTEYARKELELEVTSVVDADAAGAKEFQFQEVVEALRAAMNECRSTVEESPLFLEASRSEELFLILARLVMAEISTAIKGHSLEKDKPRYVGSERSLSRLHGLLTSKERELVYLAYEYYHRAVFEELEVLDTDDIAISLLGRLRTPIWQLKRRALGFDYVFVDETQLFNENERRLLPLLTKGTTVHVPVVLALDESQEFYGQRSAGLAALGLEDIASENLSSIHRSTVAIVRVAFFVIQRTTDLFGADFPNFTGIATSLIADDHPLAAPPRIYTASGDTRSIGKSVLKRYREMRKAGLENVGVICHADQYWDSLETELRGASVPLHVMLQRGERTAGFEPHVVLSRPAFVGGQEFDGVIVVGLEQGVTPPRVRGNEALAVAVEQQALREMYVSITRARYRLVFVLAADASPNDVLAAAESADLVVRG
jgi:hypothetical protein